MTGMWIGKSVVCPVLIGRGDYLTSLDHLTHDIRQGRGQTALVSGEAGLGKTRLVTELIHRAEEMGIEVVNGKCFETDRSFPYAPLIDLLRTFAANQSAHNSSRDSGTTSSEPLRIQPELAALISNTAPTPAFEPEQEKRRLFQSLEQNLIEKSGHSLLIVIEDLHWSDDISLEFLLYLARHIRAWPILLLMTYRSDETHPGLAHFLAEMDRERLATELILTKFSMNDVDAMLRAIFDLNRRVRSEFINAMYSLTGGNPFFIEEVLKSLIMAGDIFYQDGTWDRRPIEELKIPRGVQDLVRRRVGQVSEGAKEILTIAAAIGQRFEFSILRDLSTYGEAELVRFLKELIDAQLIGQESAERFAFRHALTREAVYSQLLARERIVLHQKIGEAIEQRATEFLDPHIANLAYHFYQAEAWQKAMEYSQRAGEKAQTLYAPHAAIQHFNHALESALRLSLAPSSSAYRARGAAYERMGDFERARADYQAAYEATQIAQDHQGEWHSLIDLGTLWAGRDYSETRKYYERAYEVARDTNDPEMLAHTLNRLGNWHVNAGKPGEGLQYHQEALNLFQSLNDQKGLAETFDLLGMANYIHGDLVQSEVYYSHALEIFRELDDREGLISSLASMMLNNDHLQSGMAVVAKTDRGIVLEGGYEAIRISREIGWRSGEAYALITTGNYLGQEGDYATAFDFLKTSLAITEEIEHSQWRTYSQYGLGLLYFDILDIPQAREHLELGLKLAEQIGSQWWVTNISGFLALVYVLEKKHEHAASVLSTAPNLPIDSLWSDSLEPLALNLGQRVCWYALSSLSLSMNHPEAALRTVDHLLSSSSNLPIEGSIPRLSILRGQILTTLRRYKEAEEALLRAQKTVEEEGELPLLWRIQLEIGRLHQHQKHHEEAANAFRTARQIIGEISTNIPDLDGREIFLKGALAGLPESHPLSARQAASKAFGGLTAREREVAILIAQGKSHREISEALVISERTVEGHVESILSRLGFASRSQIAVWAAEKFSSESK
jgi:tetratricopeptide (TPR) repeat protein